MIESKRDESQDLTTLTVSGRVGADEMMAAMKEMYAEGPTTRVLWDCTGADITGVDYEGVQRISQLAVELGSSRPGGRTAIVSSQQIVFGITRVYESLLQGSVVPLEIRVYQTLEEAREFLGLDEPSGT